ncbi:hypothetical protein F2P81_002332 [Scophthalmus maximus]|uniref:Transmembrane protein n=1 Tax=Scophthalmus maximus TaxID=52904 RepID=A0A6A4TIH0_SCOMX|nr:hypothetical protein F2P81_002332 [Scophthalmus maximus]
MQFVFRAVCRNVLVDPGNKGFCANTLSCLLFFSWIFFVRADFLLSFQTLVIPHLPTRRQCSTPFSISITRPAHLFPIPPIHPFRAAAGKTDLSLSLPTPRLHPSGCRCALPPPRQADTSALPPASRKMFLCIFSRDTSLSTFTRTV